MWPFSKNSESVRSSQQNAAAATQLHLRIAEIRNNTLVLKNGSTRTILRVTSTNFNLKSQEEQDAIIYSYQNFLNSLEFPIQIIIRSRKLDLDKYIERLKKVALAQTNSLLQKQTYDYIDYIQRLIEYANIMDKEFYVVVPSDPGRSVKKNFVEKFWERMHPQDTASAIFRRHAEFDQLKKTLQQRVNVVVTGLENTGLKTKELTTEEIIALFYQDYNPLTSRNQKVENPANLKLATDQALGRV